MKMGKVLLWIVVGILVLGLLTLAFFPNMAYAIKDLGKAASGDASICNPPAGVSLQDWQTHMSHHPDIYKNCPNN